MRSSILHVARGVLVSVTLGVALACGSVAPSSTDAGANGGGDGSASDGGSSTGIDAAAIGDATIPLLPDGGAFCTGSTPRAIVNGMDANVINASGVAFALNCCDSAEVKVATGSFQAILSVLWRLPAGATTSSLIDVGNAPMGFTIELDLGCDPGTMSCSSGGGEERYTEGFQGTIQSVAGTNGVSVSYCLSVAESPAAPHSVIHSFQLYAPNVASMF